MLGRNFSRSSCTRPSLCPCCVGQTTAIVRTAGASSLTGHTLHAVPLPSTHAVPSPSMHAARRAVTVHARVDSHVAVTTAQQSATAHAGRVRTRGPWSARRSRAGTHPTGGWMRWARGGRSLSRWAGRARGKSSACCCGTALATWRAPQTNRRASRRARTGIWCTAAARPMDGTGRCPGSTMTATSSVRCGHTKCLTRAWERGARSATSASSAPCHPAGRDRPVPVPAVGVEGGTRCATAAHGVERGLGPALCAEA